MRALRSLLLCTVLLCTVLLLGVLSGCMRPNPFESDAPPFTWQQLSGEFNPNTSLVATRGGSLFAFEGSRRLLRSTDQGGTWSSVFEVPETWSRFTGLLATGPNDAVYVVAGRREPGSTFTTSYGLFRSADGGDTWRAMPLLYASQVVRGLAVGSGGGVYVGTEGPGQQGVYRANETGSLWTATDALTEDGVGGIPSSRALVAGSQNTVLARLVSATAAGREELFYRSEDDGRRWSRLPAPDRQSLSPLSLAVSRRGHAYAFSGEDLHFARRGSSRWEPRTIPDEIFDLTFNRHDHLFVAAGFNGLYRSTDGGVTWEAMNEGFPVRPDGRLLVGITRLLVDGRGFLYAVTTGGLYRSEVPVE